MKSTLARMELIASAAACAILIGTAIYWVTQVIGVMEMLRLAYP